MAREASTSDSNIILLSYLSASHAHEHQPIEKPSNSLEPQHPHPQPHRKPKKLSQNERMRTDLDDLDSVSEVDFLRRENECLKGKLAKCEKRVVKL
jgi:hypothetical protein